MSPKLIDIITNVMAFLLFVLEPIKSYLDTQPFDWFNFAMCVLAAVVAFFTGKSAKSIQKKV